MMRPADLLALELKNIGQDLFEQFNSGLRSKHSCV